MKQLTCEMCGSTDLIKQDGVFVCQNCGTKYSVEEAKKMMIEGTVDVSGSSIKIDRSNELDNLLKLARISAESKDDADAVKYYKQIFELDPNCIEALFYLTYYKAINSPIAYVSKSIKSIDSILDATFEEISSIDDEQIKHSFLADVLNKSLEVYDGIDHLCEHYYPYLHLGDMLLNHFPADNMVIEYVQISWEKGLKKAKRYKRGLFGKRGKVIKEHIAEYEAKLKTI